MFHSRGCWLDVSPATNPNPRLLNQALRKIMDRLTIAAIATPIGHGGIGIIKISGPRALAVAHALFRPSRPGLPGADLKLLSHHLYHGCIVDPQSNDQIDEVLLTFMQAPHSYTCEDIVEIQAHSGIAVLRRILSMVLSQNVRHAEPGEFTKRAFLNGRIDLSQAEGVMDTIAAQSRQGLQIAMAQMTGRMQQQVRSIRRVLTQCLAQIETAIDFIEDLDGDIVNDTLPSHLHQTVVKPLDTLIDQYRRAHLFRDGLKMAVVGKPNVGKSSLLNWLIKKDRAIVTDIPGTTRDLIEESVTIKGIPILVVDTAGLRENGDSIEKIGIRKTRDCIEEADLILFMLDATKGPQGNDLRIFNQIKNKNVLIVKNKIDLLAGKKVISLPHEWEARPVIEVSALKQIGIDALEKAILRSVSQVDDVLNENPIVPNLRQKGAIERAKTASLKLIKGLEGGVPLEISAIDASEAIDALGLITGETIANTVIDQIFSRFCIGK